jgi:hypothetical protein
MTSSRTIPRVTFRARFEDEEGQFVENDFTLTVKEGPATPGNPSQPGSPGQPESPDQPAAPAKPARVTGLASLPGMQFINLSWDAPARAASYEVYYSPANTFASATKFAEESTEPKAMVTGLEDGKEYYFWVVAKNEGGSADESRTYKSERTSDPIPEYLRKGVELKGAGKTAFFVAHNLWPSGDRCGFKDLGEAYPAHECYLFAYGAGKAGIDGDLYP